MAKNQISVGHTRIIDGQTTGHLSGDLVIFNSWPGVIQANIIGTTEELTTIEGRPITGEFGDGRGDMQIEGVFTFQDRGPAGGFPALVDGDIANRADASGVTSEGGIGATTAGHVMGTPFDVEGVLFVDVKLLGRPGT